MTAPTPRPDASLRGARERIAQLETDLQRAITSFEETCDAEIVAIHLTKTASGNVRVQRTILVQIEVRL